MSGWEPRQFTEYEYDGDRLIGTVTTLEPEFDAGEVALLLAYQDLVNDRGSHGLPLSETMDPRANPATWDGWRYEANQAPRIDYAGQAIAQAQDAYYKANPDVPRGGHVWYARRVEG